MVGILYICTGKYICFWESFYNSARTNFLPSTQKIFYVFTDKPWRFWFRYKNVIAIYTPKSVWPFATLYRFKYFLSIKNKLKNISHLFFFNANVIFQKEITTEFLPQADQEFLFVKHPGFYDKTDADFTFERNPNSTAYISEGDGVSYIMGGVIGGKTEAFIRMCVELDQNIKNDLEKGLIAIWHDESHLNKYFLENNSKVKILNPDYGYPEGWDLPFDPKIVIRDKSNFGGHKFLRSK